MNTNKPFFPSKGRKGKQKRKIKGRQEYYDFITRKIQCPDGTSCIGAELRKETEEYIQSLNLKATK